jgi:hypothetical protein
LELEELEGLDQLVMELLVAIQKFHLQTTPEEQRLFMLMGAEGAVLLPEAVVVDCLALEVQIMEPRDCRGTTSQRTTFK